MQGVCVCIHGRVFYANVATYISLSLRCAVAGHIYFTYIYTYIYMQYICVIQYIYVYKHKLKRFGIFLQRFPSVSAFQQHKRTKLIWIFNVLDIKAKSVHSLANLWFNWVSLRRKDKSYAVATVFGEKHSERLFPGPIESIVNQWIPLLIFGIHGTIGFLVFSNTFCPIFYERHSIQQLRITNCGVATNM